MKNIDIKSTTNPKLRVHDLEKRYGDVNALRPTSLEVASGEFLTLLGPSGSGKTTLLMMVAGLTLPSGGDIWIDGRISTDLPPQQRDIGVVFQNYALFPHLSVYENIAFPLRMRRMATPDIERDVRRVLEIVALPAMADRLPKELSGGQQQRVALARCAVYRPSIILMDEPLGALDKKLRDSMQLEIKRMHRELGATIVYVTHDQGEAMSMSDRVCVMRDGGIEQLSTPADLYHRPANRFVGDFLGGAAFLKAAAVGQDGANYTVKHQSGEMLRTKMPTKSGAAGSDALCMIRPQHLTVSAMPDMMLNNLPATVVESIMTGTMTEHHVKLDDGTPVTAVELTKLGNPVWERGSKVHVNWKAEDTIVFTGDELR